MSSLTPEMDAPINNIVVLGDGIAGLAIAAALQPYAQCLQVVGRDPAPMGVEPRRHLPQGRQIHNLAHRAWTNLDELMPGQPGTPGYIDHLNALGAGTVHVPRDLHATVGGVQMPREGDFGIQWRTARRMTMELSAHRVLAEAHNVRFLGRTLARGLRIDDTAVTGVAVEHEITQGQTILAADIVVDAMGALSAVPRWLRGAGLPAPDIASTPSGRWYTGLVVERPQTDYEGNSLWVNLPGEDQTKSGIVSPVDPDHWQVSTSGFEDDTPPTTFGEVKAHFRGLPGGDEVAELLDSVSTPADQNFFPAYKLMAVRQANDANTALPTGLLRAGDAVYRPDPILGHGMAIATTEAIMLGAIVAGHGDNLAAITYDSRRYVSRAGAAAREAADFLTNPDGDADYETVMRRLHLADVNPLELLEQ